VEYSPAIHPKTGFVEKCIGTARIIADKPSVQSLRHTAIRKSDRLQLAWQASGIAIKMHTDLSVVLSRKESFEFLQFQRGRF